MLLIFFQDTEPSNRPRLPPMAQMTAEVAPRGIGIGGIDSLKNRSISGVWRKGLHVTGRPLVHVGEQDEGAIVRQALRRDPGVGSSSLWLPLQSKDTSQPPRKNTHGL